MGRITTKVNLMRMINLAATVAQSSTESVLMELGLMVMKMEFVSFALRMINLFFNEVY